MKLRIAIIGAGISGLTLASYLKNYAEVVVFEKARGVGGRMSTRYADPFYFDHGTQYFTARTKQFSAFLKPYIETGVVVAWSGKIVNFELGKKTTKRMWFEPHYVASPNMNSLCKSLAEGVDVRCGIEIAPLCKREAGGWHMKTTEGVSLGMYDYVISTAPSVQTVHLFGNYLPQNTGLHSAEMLGCYALMIGINRPWDKQWIAANVQHNPIAWIAINSTKPARNVAHTSMVIHSCNRWAEQHIDDDMGEAQAFLVDQFEKVTGISCSNAGYVSTHRWRYALKQEKEKSEVFHDALNGLAATGDWTSHSRIEDVWSNAMTLAHQIAKQCA